MQYNFPTDRYYDRKHHMWGRRERDAGRVLVGIDALGLESLGDLAYLVLPEMGAAVTRGQPCGTLEAAKMTGDLVAPFSGTVVARNDQVLSDPSLVNRDNYGQGWLFAIEPCKWTNEYPKLAHGAGIADWVEAETARYREQGWIHGG
jgi:glycine cleavage system H protein